MRIREGSADAQVLCWQRIISVSTPHQESRLTGLDAQVFMHSSGMVASASQVQPRA
jgi:hypothetical protein